MSRRTVWSVALVVLVALTVPGRLAAGDFAGRVRIPNRDELGTLAADVNGMSAELDRLYEQIETASRRKSEFLANMSHELRTRLNAIIGGVRSCATCLRLQRGLWRHGGGGWRARKESHAVGECGWRGVDVASAQEEVAALKESQTALEHPGAGKVKYAVATSRSSISRSGARSSPCVRTAASGKPSA